MRWPRRPYSRIGFPKECHHRHAHRRRQMTDSTIVANVAAGASQPSGQVKQILETGGPVERFLRARRPFHGVRQDRGQFAKPGQRPVLAGGSGERMDHDRVSGRHLSHRNSRHQAHRRAGLRGIEIGGMVSVVLRKGRMKRERQSSHRLPKLLVVGSVPGDNPIELRQPRHGPFGRVDTHQIQAGRRDRIHMVRKTHEGLIGETNPNFRVLGTEVFERRQADDAISDRAGPDQKCLQRRSIGIRTSTDLGGKHTVSEHAW